jgi:dipeptidyl aminopeptidase/acylaminoacyl peptidase
MAHGKKGLSLLISFNTKPITMKIQTLFLSLSVMATLATISCSDSSTGKDFIGKSTTTFENDLLSPEALWSLGRIGSYQMAPDNKMAIYNVTYYSVEQNKSHTILYKQDFDKNDNKLLTKTNDNERGPVFFNNGKKVLFLSNKSGSNQLWTMNADGSGRKQVSDLNDDISEFLLSPDEKQLILIMEVEDTTNIQKNDEDLSLSSGMVINDYMYKHWDQFVKTIPHPFLAEFDGKSVTVKKDILEGEPYECPMLPFGGAEQLAWSPDSKTIAYTCRKKTGVDYATSTDSDIFLYNLEEGSTRNICKPEGFVEPETEATRSKQDQSINKQTEDCNMGYDQNPQYSPDGKYIAWQSMERDGYESDRTRLCVYEIATGKKTYVTESFESGVDTYLWGDDSQTLYFTGVWHGTIMVYKTNLEGDVQKLTDGTFDYSLVSLADEGQSLIVKRHSMSQADEVYKVALNDNNKVTQLTDENGSIYSQLTMGNVEERWIPTVDGKEMLTWVIYPPHFDSTKTYPTLLYCEGGPQSPVSQFWSYRWNFQIMAAHGYIVVAPNRRGLPGFGMEWLEEISGDYTGLCMQDQLSAIDALCKEPYVDKDRLGCVGASFGGFSVYWLAGHHNKRFKCFISHDGIFNTHQQYAETEEMWFPNWDLGAAPWTAEGKALKAYTDSPHLSVDKWDTPILCIHGMKDYRILHSQGQAAFDAALLRGIDAQLLLFPDENHWVLKPQNGVLWQRTFFRWLDKWLKK